MYRVFVTEFSGLIKINAAGAGLMNTLLTKMCDISGIVANDVNRCYIAAFRHRQLPGRKLGCNAVLCFVLQRPRRKRL